MQENRGESFIKSYWQRENVYKCAKIYKKDEMVSDYSESFVSSRHRIKRKEL